MSVSTTPTRRPPRARRVARLALRFDFPVPPRKEWTEMILVTTIASSSDLDRSFCDRTRLEDNPETDEWLALVGGQGVAVGGAAGRRLVAPRPAAQDAVLPRCRPRRGLS